MRGPYLCCVLVALAACGQRGREADNASPSGDTSTPPPSRDADARGDADETAPPIPVGRFLDLSSSEGSICALDRTGLIWCWRDDGERFDGAVGRFVAIGTGEANACGIDADGQALCPSPRAETMAGETVGPYGAITGGDGFTCALGRDGRVACWGRDAEQLEARLTGTFGAIDAAGDLLCGLTTGRAILCASLAEAAPPVLGRGRFDALAVSPGDVCGLSSDGAIRCAGEGVAADPPAERLSQLTASSSRRCGLSASGRIRCWDQSGDDFSSPGSDIFLDVATSREQICGILETRFLRCWGGPSEPISSDEARGVGVELRGVRVQADAKRQDLRGLAVVFEYRLPGGEFEEIAWLSGRLERVEKGYVKAALADRWYRDTRGRVRAKARLLADAHGEWREAYLFFPYCAMDLGPGDHTLRVDIKARRIVEFGRPVESTPLIAEALPPAVVSKPGSTTVRLGVRSAEVPAGGEYDASDFGDRQKLPDLFWELELRGDRTIDLFSSPVVADQLAARWSVVSPPFAVSDGDLVTLRVAEEDFALADELMVFPLSVEDLREIAAARGRGGGLVARPGFQVELGTVEIR